MLPLPEAMCSMHEATRSRPCNRAYWAAVLLAPASVQSASGVLQAKPATAVQAYAAEPKGVKMLF